MNTFKQVNYLCVWEDPDDYDQGMNRGAQTFESEEEFTTWINNIVDHRPLIEFTLYRVQEMAVEALEVKTQYKVVGIRHTKGTEIHDGVPV